jgi:CubicO group peptidase (beta-lactamase class C family)
MIRIITITIILFLSMVVQLSCTSEKSDHTQHIREVETHLMPAVAFEGEPVPTYRLDERMRHYKVPGLSIAFVDNGQLAWARGYGYHSFDSVKKVTPETMFQAASISKPVAALAALSLVEDSLLALDEDVNRYLERWQVPDNRFTDTSRVTLRRLMTHTAGLTVHGFPGYEVDDTVPSVAGVLSGSKTANTGAVYPDTIPGSIWRYSGGGYTVMQLMMEEATGKDFAGIMQKRVLEPLNMNHSTYVQPLPEQYHHQAGIAHDEQGREISGRWHVYPEKAAAGLWTTPSDLARYIMEVQQSLDGASNRVISREMTRRMLSNHKGDWGLGPALDGKGDSLMFQHGGANAGYRCRFFAFAGQDQGVAIMTNSDNGGDLITEMMRSIDRAYGWNHFKTEKKKRVNLPQKQLAAYAGKYRMNPQVEVKVELEGDHLTILPSWGGVETEFYPASDSIFFDLEKDWTVHFKMDAGGDIKGFYLNDRSYFSKVE